MTKTTTYRGYQITLAYSEYNEFVASLGMPGEAHWTVDGKYWLGQFADADSALAAAQADLDQVLTHPITGHVFADRAELAAYHAAKDAGNVTLARNLAGYPNA